MEKVMNYHFFVAELVADGSCNQGRLASREGLPKKGKKP
jgi:hypothetical protein